MTNYTLIFSDWLDENHEKLYILGYRTTKADVIYKFLVDFVGSDKSDGIEKCTKTLIEITKDLSGSFSSQPSRTADSIIKHFGIGWPTSKDDNLVFGIEYWQINTEYMCCKTIYTCLESREQKGAWLDLWARQAEELEEFKRKLHIQTMNAGDGVLTYIENCKHCNRYTPVSPQYEYYNRRKPVCGECLDANKKMKELRDQKNQILKITKKLQGEIK